MTIKGASGVYEHTADSGRRGWFRWCPACAATIAYTIEALSGLVGIPLGAFAGVELPALAFSVWEDRQQPWVAIVGEGVEHRA